MKSKSFIQSKKQKKKKPQTKLTLNNKIKSGFFVLFLIPLFTMQPFFPTNKQFSPALPAALPSLCGTVWSYNSSTVRWAAVSRSSSSHSWSRSHSGFSSRRVTWPTRTAARGGKKKTWTEKQRKRVLKAASYPGGGGVWAWGWRRCPGRPAGCVERRAGTGGGALGPGGRRGAPWWSEAVRPSEWPPAGPPHSAAPRPSEGNHTVRSGQVRSGHVRAIQKIILPSWTFL